MRTLFAILSILVSFAAQAAELNCAPTENYVVMHVVKQASCPSKFAAGWNNNYRCISSSPVRLQDGGLYKACVIESPYVVSVSYATPFVP